MMKAYLKRARQIIGKRTRAAIDYDNTVIAHLAEGEDIQTAVAAANQKHPNEALLPKPNQWPDVAAHYEYLLEHAKILQAIGNKDEP